MTAAPIARQLLLAAALACSSALYAQQPLPGGDLASLLSYAREHNPEFAAMRYEAQAAQERVEVAGALPDPRLRTTLSDITRAGEQNPSLLPARVGRTSYQWMQDVPWFGKRDLKREIAQQDALGAKGRAQGSWIELASRIKSTYAQLYVVQRSEQLVAENLVLMAQLEQAALARYAGGLSAQQDVIRAQVEQGGMSAEQIALEMEHHHLHIRLNALLARPLDAPLAKAQALPPLPAGSRLDWAALRERAASNNPQLAAQQALLQSAQKNRDLVQKNRYPDFLVGLAPTQIGSKVKEWELMFELNIPLQQGTRGAQEREAQALLAAAQERSQAVLNQLFTELTQSLSALEAARRTEELTRTSLLPQAELTFQSALAAYETGKVDFATLLDAQKQIRSARLSQLKAQLEAQLQVAEIERILGEEI